MALLAVGATAPLCAQDTGSGEDDQEVAPVQLPERFRQDQDVAEEQFDDLEYDDETGTYRLIEDDAGDDWVEPPSDRETQAEELKRLFELYKEALDNKAFEEADTLAKRVVELSISLNGLDSMDSAKAISNLGIAQHNNKDYESAVRNFESAIDIVERIDNRLSEELINPLQGLAASLAAEGRPDLAKDAYQRAVHISHVNDGPHNKKQIRTLESMAELDISTGDIDDASQLQEMIFAIEARNIDPESVDILPALENKANWAHRLQDYHQERITWRQIIDIVEDKYGKESVMLIAPLTNLGKSYLYVSPIEYDFQPQVSVSSGESYLRRADRIAEQSPDSTWELRENTLLSLGDYYILSGRPNRASREYRNVWELLSDGDDPERLRDRRDNLETVTRLQRVFPPRYYNSQMEDQGQPPPDSFETGTMSFQYTVSATGRVADVVLVEIQPQHIEDFEAVVSRRIRRQVFRPRLVDGEMVSTPEMIYTHEFFYRPADLPPPEPVADTEATEE